MSKWLREFRLIPVVLIAAGCLLALKSLGLILDGGYTLGHRIGSNKLVVTTIPVEATPQLRSPAASLDARASTGTKSWMQEMFNYPDVTGSVAAKPKEPPKEAGGDDKAAKKEGPIDPPDAKSANGTVIPLDQAARPPSGAERALLERLQERRQDLDARLRDLDLRESLLKDAEKKLETEGPRAKVSDAKDGAPAQRREPSDAARMKALVTMYETMKPKEAAKIFDRLDIRVLIEVASQIKPQIMSAILAQMSAEAAERFTVELASRGGGAERTVNPSTLPKIDGKAD